MLETEARSEAGEPYRVVSCESCGLRYTRPLPSHEEVIALYPDAYYGGAPDGGTEGAKDDSGDSAGDFNRDLVPWERVRLLLHEGVMAHRRRSLRSAKVGRVLDVGCGDGDFLAGLARRGWEASGTDLSPPAVARARAKGLTVHEGLLEQLDSPDGSGFPDEPFDAITLWHVLEHLAEPRTALRTVHRWLRPEGVLVIEVPDSASWTLQWCGAQWFPLDVPRHLQHFTPRTLEELLEREGFRVMERLCFHPFDFVLTAMSAVHRLGLLARGQHYFVDSFREASPLRKAVFLLLGAPILAASLPYSWLSTLLSGHGETVRVVARKR